MKINFLIQDPHRNRLESVDKIYLKATLEQSLLVLIIARQNETYSKQL